VRFQRYEWDDVNIDHIGSHNVIPQEIEEANFNEPLVMKARGKRYIVYGRSDSGRYIFIVAVYKGKGVVRAITARNMTQSERRLYNKKRG